MTENQKPVKRFSAGAVSASVFVNTNDKNTWFSVIIQKVYNAGTDEEVKLKNTNSYNVNDLPDVRLVSEQAYEFVRNNKATELKE